MYKSNWDYFCELMVAIPGLADVFYDADEMARNRPVRRESGESRRQSARWSPPAPGRMHTAAFGE